MLFAPYHGVVRLILRRAFADISRGHGERAAAQFSGRAVFRFYGEHAMGGELRGRETIAAWFARLHHLFPDLRLTPLQIVVNGPPWNTTVATRFGVEASLRDGTPYRNEGMQYVRIAWGRILEDRLYEDTGALQEALRALAAAGVAEARAPALGASPT